jgi:hypothetical protein
VLGLTPSALALSGTWMWWRRRSRATAPKPAPVTVTTSSDTAVKWIFRATLAATLVAAYIIVARSFGRWTFDARFAEFWLVKPIAIGLVVFPVTGLLVWLALCARKQPALFAGMCALLSGWYLVLTGILMR